ncbi:MAG: hypothetical protein HY862_01510 [Chloroflexi bacterium]|nr:hypothetical protein [Chloroflexota bacterium]
MELLTLWNFVLRRWWLIAIPAAITLLWSLPAIPDAISPPETYGATMRFTAAAPPDETNAAAVPANSTSGTYEDTAYVPWLASEYVVVNMPQWVTSSSFTREVSATLQSEYNLDISTDDLRPAFAADSARSIFVVYFGWDNEAELEKIAAATITVLQTRNQQYFPQFAYEPAQIVPLDEIDVVRTVPPLTTRLNPFIRIVIGLAAGLGLAVLAEYLDDSVRDKADLEKIGLEMLGVIPRT